MKGGVHLIEERRGAGFASALKVGHIDDLEVVREACIASHVFR